MLALFKIHDLEENADGSDIYVEQNTFDTMHQFCYGGI